MDECRRERRIVTRNIIVVGILVAIIIALLVRYVLPVLTIRTGDVAGESNADGGFGAYYQWILLVVFFLSILYPLVALLRVFNRKKNAEKAFSMIENGATCTIVTDQTMYLTIVPLIWVRLNLNPVHYLEIVVNHTKGFSLPVNPNFLPDIKRALSDANLAYYQDVMAEIYGEKEVEATDEEFLRIKSLAAFQQFAQQEFAGELDAMEEGRAKNKNMLYVQFAVAFAFVGGMVWYSLNPDAFSNPTDILRYVGGFIGISVLLSYGFYFYSKRNASTTSHTQFKKSIFSRLVRYINPKLEYIEKAHIGLPELLHSGLFEEQVYGIGGADQIIGRHNGVPFQSCNLTLTYRPAFRAEKEEDDLVFSGNYFVARFPKKFETNIAIHPKKGFFSKNLNDNDISAYLNTDGEKIRLEDPDFQKQFEVYCDDQIQARYILTPALMERLKTINARNKGNVYIAINGSNIVVATNRQSATDVGNSAYGMMFTKIDQKLLDGIYTELAEQLSVIDTLKLNNEIWKN